MHNRIIGVVAGVFMMLGGVGCDRLPWQSSSESTPAGRETTDEQPASTLPMVPPHEQVATVNRAVITLTDMELAVQELKRLVQAAGQTWETLPAEERDDQLDLVDVLENLIDAELKAQDVRARGWDRKTDLQRNLAYLQRGFLAQEWERRQRETATPTEEQIHQFYETNKAAFVDPERIRVRVVVTKDADLAEAVRSQAVAGIPFDQLARERSIAASKDAGGDIGWVVRALDLERLRLLGELAQDDKAFFQQLEPLAFALEVGQVSQPVKGPDGYYLVKLEERQAARQRTELEVRDAIRVALTVEKMREALAQLRKQHEPQIQQSLERLKDIVQ